MDGHDETDSRSSKLIKRTQAYRLAVIIAFRSKQLINILYLGIQFPTLRVEAYVALCPHSSG
jgi:hypothetical protein